MNSLFLICLLAGSSILPSKGGGGGGITALTGDVTASGTGSVAATITNAVKSVASVGGSPSASAASISGTTLTLHLADSSHPGLIGGTSAAQTLVPALTLSNTLLVSGILSAGSGPTTLTDSTGKILSAALVNGTAVANLSGTNTGDLTLGSVAGSPNAAGAVLTGQALTLSLADGSHPGLVGGTSTAQTLVPALTLSNGLTVNGGNVVVSGGNVLSFTATGKILSNSTLDIDGCQVTNVTSGVRLIGNLTHLAVDCVNNVTQMGGANITIKMATIVASTTQTLAAATVCSDVCNVGTVANAADAVKLQLAVTGGSHVTHIFNQGANAMSLFPDASGSIICTPATIFGAASCGSAGASISVAVGEILDCVQYDTTATWGCK